VTTYGPDKGIWFTTHIRTAGADLDGFIKKMLGSAGKISLVTPDDYDSTNPAMSDSYDFADWLAGEDASECGC
jgi:hypothetical protein